MTSSQKSKNSLIKEENADLKIWIAILIAVAALVIGLVLGFVLGGLHRKKVAEAAIGSAEQEANKIISDAISTAEAKKKDKVKFFKKEKK